jgi:hypothetical protein
MNRKNKVFVTIIVLFLLVFIFYVITREITLKTGYAVRGEALDNFAQCMSEKGVKFYGSMYCGHCKNQKDLFKDSLRYLNYFECTEPENEEACRKLMGVPAWEINGEITYGTQSLEKLSRLTGCEI